MKKLFFLCVLGVLISSCKNENDNAITIEPFIGIAVDTLLTDSISIRAIAIDSATIWYAATKGKYGYLNLKTDKGLNGYVAKDTLQLEFRSIAKTTNHIFILTVGNPALLYRISKDGSQIDLVYQEDHDKVFYDSMQFWNDNEGIAMGDPTGECLSVIITRDGGSTWKKLSCEELPETVEGEAAFAASNSNLVVKSDHAWMVSGGKKARVFHSADKGKTWKVRKTPIVQGEAMTGIFTADFYDTENGFVAGGNYDKPGQNFKNKAITHNGGKRWKLIADKTGFGYASCVQYVPNSNAQALVTVGASGLHYSSDSGKNWKQLSTDKDLFTIRFMNDSTAIAAGKNKIIRIKFQK